jgi:hypothetical protein
MVVAFLITDFWLVQQTDENAERLQIGMMTFLNLSI